MKRTGEGPLNRQVQAESLDQRGCGPDLSPDISFQGMGLLENAADRQGIFGRAQVNSIKAKALALETEDAFYLQRYGGAAGPLMVQTAADRPIPRTVSFVIIQTFECYGSRYCPFGRAPLPLDKPVGDSDHTQLAEEGPGV